MEHDSSCLLLEYSVFKIKFQSFYHNFKSDSSHCQFSPDSIPYVEVSRRSYLICNIYAYQLL